MLFSEEAQKAAQFIQLANKIDTPLVFVQNMTGYMVGKRYEQGGIVKHGSLMVNAVSNSAVPHLTLQVGGSYGAGNYGMSGRAFKPRFLFVWPNAKTAVMGPEQLAGVLSIVARAGAAAAASRSTRTRTRSGGRGRGADRARADGARDRARGYDDGIIDPRDTRTVLGSRCRRRSATRSPGAREFGVFRL